MSSVGQARAALSPGEVSAAGAVSGAVTRSDIHRENDSARRVLEVVFVKATQHKGETNN